MKPRYRTSPPDPKWVKTRERIAEYHRVQRVTRLMVNALYAPYRSLPCEHEHMPYRGEIPCTGPRVCTMCGATEYDLLETMTPLYPR